MNISVLPAHPLPLLPERVMEKFITGAAFPVLLLGLLLVGAVPAPCETITVGSADAEPGDSLSLEVSIDIPDNTAAAVFTLTYDTQYLTLAGIDSIFFDTFHNQWLATVPQPSPLPPDQVTVDGTIYTRPLLAATETGMTLIAAAKVQPGNTTSILFTLHFTVAADAPDGIYTVSISPTVLDNPAYGYDAAGETLPILVGADQNQQDLTLAFPSINPTVVNGAINVNTPFTDDDGDNIDDNWELNYVADLSLLSAGGDKDGDGYTDLQEYLNSLSGNDPEGNPYNPLVKNAPYGTGYTNPGAGSLPAVYLLLLNTQ